MANKQLEIKSDAKTWPIHGFTEDLTHLVNIAPFADLREKIHRFQSARPVGDPQPIQLRFSRKELDSIELIVRAEVQVYARAGATERDALDRFKLWGKILNALNEAQ